MRDSYREKFPKGPDWKTPKKNPYGFCGLNESSYHGMEVVGYAKEKVVDFDSSYDGMFEDKLLICDTRDMTADGHTKGSIDRKLLLEVMSGRQQYSHATKEYKPYRPGTNAKPKRGNASTERRVHWGQDTQLSFVIGL